MSRTAALIGAGLLGLLCLGAAAAWILLAKVGGPATLLRMYNLQSSASAQACVPPARLVPGSYQAGPVQVTGDFVWMAYTADCAEPGQPAQSLAGFAARSSQDIGCAGSGVVPAAAPAAGTVTVDGVSSSQCGSLEPGGALSVVTGRVVGAGASGVQVQYTSGVKAVGPIRGGRFAIAAPEASPVCAVRALDAGGAVLAEAGMAALGVGGC